MRGRIEVARVGSSPDVSLLMTMSNGSAIVRWRARYFAICPTSAGVNVRRPLVAASVGKAPSGAGGERSGSDR
jgi:hypothetical protein